MKKLISSILLAVTLVLPSILLGAPTVKIGEKIIEITNIDADFVWSDYPKLDPNGISVVSILFHPGAISDVLYIKEINDAGPGFKITAVVASQPLNFPMYGAKFKLVIDYSACTLNSGHKVTIITR